MDKIVKIRIKKITDDAITPKKQTQNSSGYDLYSNENTIIEINQTKLVHTGIIMEIPEGFEIQVRPRSGLALKKSIAVLNSPGTIDSDFRGEIGVILHNFGNKVFSIAKGDRIAQMVLNEVFGINFSVVDKLKETDRGSGGFGSTDNKNIKDFSEIGINMATKEGIIQWLDVMKIKNYYINKDLSVNVDGDVDIAYNELTKIPVQFGDIKGDFDCHDNNLISLDFAPKKCNFFDCHYNPKLTEKYLSNFDFSFVKGGLSTDYEYINDKWNKRLDKS